MASVPHITSYSQVAVALCEEKKTQQQQQQKPNSLW
jgi:hypothetical protein